MIRGCFHPGGIKLTEKLLDRWKVNPGEQVLDLGCGAGETVAYLRERQYQAWGIDREPQGSPYLKKGSLNRLPLKDGSMAAIISECSLSISGMVQEGLKESYRVLMNQGVFMLSDVYFYGDELPEFADQRPVTLEQWEKIVQQEGYRDVEIEDVSWAWKEFVCAQLWAGRTIEDLWCGNLPKTCGKLKVGYFLLWARKG